ncbi:piriformospora indica-insensitive protein 2 [Vigna unguiculata]|uniref:Protein brassinosteroid insensitive 1 n=1 Tax=Vigna unguiculata TaxID=3917 RepID=A0A4D6MYW1_VIGUN|nr:piriformospora indica-insensitive protein 2 [Vigna unguiculata]QCE06730.1 protein brassinosteroid insensitive 1 [Vigna unguiculata]
MAVLSILLLSLLFSVSHQQPHLDSSEQESVYQILHSLNPTIPWRNLFPDDLCLSAPHGVVCDYPTQLNQTPHIVELSFGYVSDETPNPPCSPNATLHFHLFNSFPYLRKLFFYNCFNHTPLSLSPSFSLPSSLQELVFINNPSFISPLASLLQNLTSLRRLILIGNAFHGHLPSQIPAFLNLEELTLSRNNLSGQIPSTFGLLNQLKLLDLSGNNFQACLPDSLGNLSRLLKLDLSFNAFGCRIPESLRGLRSLEFLDLSFNRLGSFGVPLFLGELPTLKEVYLSGNSLSGAIPEIWENLGGVQRLGLSEMGLVGSIPVSMGVYLKNLSYLGLDNNNLEGPVPFGLLEYGGEINLENNNLSGRVRLSTRVGQKLKLKVGGNRGLCLDNIMDKKTDVPDAVVFSGASSLLWFDSLFLFSFGVLVFTGF